MSIEKKIATIFRMTDEVWARHANPWSVLDALHGFTCAAPRGLEPNLDRMVVACYNILIARVDMDESSGIQETAYNEKLGIKSGFGGKSLAQS